MKKKDKRRIELERLLENARKEKKEKKETLESYSMMPYGFKYKIRSGGVLRTFRMIKGHSVSPLI